MVENPEQREGFTRWEGINQTEGQKGAVCCFPHASQLQLCVPLKAIKKDISKKKFLSTRAAFPYALCPLMEEFLVEAEKPHFKSSQLVQHGNSQEVRGIVMTPVLEKGLRVRRVEISNSQLPGSQLQFTLLGTKVAVDAVFKADTE